MHQCPKYGQTVLKNELQLLLFFSTNLVSKFTMLYWYWIQLLEKSPVLCQFQLPTAELQNQVLQTADLPLWSFLQNHIHRTVFSSLAERNNDHAI